MSTHLSGGAEDRAQAAARLYPPVAESAAMTQAAIDSVRGEAYSLGWLNGVDDVLRELERAHAFTTAGARRTVTRIRIRLELERPASDTVPTSTKAT